MSHFKRSGAPENRDTFSLLVLNLSFRTTADDLFPLFDRYGEVVDIYIPRDRRTGDLRGFGFVRYNYEDEAQDAVHGLDGRKVDGRVIMVQFAKYGPNSEKIHRGRITEEIPKPRGHVRSHSPRPRYRDDYRDRDYRRQSRSRSRERYEQDRYRDSDYRRRGRNRSISPDYDRKHNRYSSRSPGRRSPSYGKSHSPRKTPCEGTPSRPRDDRPPCSGNP
ncbi:Serine/arginine-rich splicing factor SC35 [Dichanthelium oligosanthes]|uniref:Serine/arginine-rich splicing factor SC35 n=1 Tax=Dichanthelium oligosanthes TaxID=888268 RepID=A0A1E5UKS9_9POAL|nr:Serine/arginine-rich splicing factor SC35 [Dichanthelium oligosanthes]